jgi:hypothetical protein
MRPGQPRVEAHRSPVPTPPAELEREPLLAHFPAGTRLYRVHSLTRAADAFNPCTRPDLRPGRFHPFYVADGTPVPVLYAGTSEEAALFETIFRDVPRAGPAKRVFPTRYRGTGLSELVLTEDLVLADLRGPGLLRFGLRPRNLTDCSAAHYPETVRWAAALHRAFAGLDGLAWTSRQDNRATAVMLFGDRVPASALAAGSAPLRLDVAPGLLLLHATAEAADILLV